MEALLWLIKHVYFFSTHPVFAGGEFLNYGYISKILPHYLIRTGITTSVNDKSCGMFVILGLNSSSNGQTIIFRKPNYFKG